MRGLDEARALYETQGRELLHREFPDWEGRIAVGLVGRGSECFGFDDEISRDHDFEPGFCLWLTDEDYAAIGVPLSRAYQRLTGTSAAAHSAMAERRLGVHRIGDFYLRYTGSPGAPESWQQWLSLPGYALAEATNGEVWRDDPGAFSAVRREILTGMPEDVRKKKLAARAVEMAQSGQYNYARCLRHGEEGAAMLALSDFVRAGCGMIYLLNRRHMPYYKWMLRGMEALPKLGDMRPALEYLLTAENDESGRATKQGVVEDICAAVIRELKAQSLTGGDWDYLEPHAFEIMGRIQNQQIRALHVMEG